MIQALKDFHAKYSEPISVILKFAIMIGFISTIYVVFRPDLNNHSNVKLPDEIQWREVGDTMVITKITNDSIHVEFVKPKYK
jgi:hypothetical protein